jgi:O-antigen/teichoic acid export membrane protein
MTLFGRTSPALNRHTLAGRLASTAASNVLAFAIAVLTSVVLTRLLGAEGRGEFAIFTASAALLSLFLTLGLDFALSYLVAQGRVPLHAIPLSAAAHAAVAGVLAFTVIAWTDRSLGAEVFLPRSKQSVGFEGLLAGLVSVTILAAGARAVYLGRRSFHRLNLADLAIAFAGLGTYAVMQLIEWRDHGAITAGLVLAVHTGLAAAGSIALWAAAFRWLGVRPGPHIIDAGAATEMVALGSRAYLGNVLQFFSYRLDVWFVAYFTDFRSLGLYALAASLGQMWWLLPRSAATVLLPVFASRERTDAATHALIGRVAFWTAATAAGVAAATAGWLIPAVYGREFAGAVAPFVLLLIGCVPYTLAIILASGLAAAGRQGDNTLASLLGFVVTVALDLFLIPRYGIAGAAVASALSYLVTTAYVLYRYGLAFGIAWPRLFLIQPGDVGAIGRAVRGATGAPLPVAVGTE